MEGRTERRKEGRKKKEGRQNYLAGGYPSSHSIFSNVFLNIFLNMCVCIMKYKRKKQETRNM